MTISVYGIKPYYVDISEMDAATVENVKWMMTYLNDCKASNVGQLFMAVQTYVWDHQSYKGEPGGDGDAGGYP